MHPAALRVARWVCWGQQRSGTAPLLKTYQAAPCVTCAAARL